MLTYGFEELRWALSLILYQMADGILFLSQIMLWIKMMDLKVESFHISLLIPNSQLHYLVFFVCFFKINLAFFLQ